MYKMSNEIQFYAWGSKSFVQDLTQQSDKVGIPAAELWMGAHPKAPSKIMLADSEQTLNRFISSAPKKVLGNSHSKYGRKLPFLLKVLAADKALSIQAHPDLDQAQYGFHREQKTRISIKSDKRNYHDANHKPELICALTDFYAMCGFRTYDQILVNFRKYELDRYFSRFEQFANLPDERSLRYLFNEILSCDADKKTRILDHIQLELDQDDLFIEHLNEADSNVRYWIQVLKDQFPDDIGILSPLFLNIIKLHPFEAIYLPARVLHAYLLGAGMEIMASSDNVLRGGLTSKNIDIPELISVLDFKPFNPVILNPKQKKNGLRIYKTPVKDFALSLLELKQNKFSSSIENAQILFCYDGSAIVSSKEQEIVLAKGESLFVPASDVNYSIDGDGLFFIASFHSA